MDEKELGKTLFWGGADHLWKDTKLKESVMLFPRIGPDGIAAARKADEERRELSRLAKLKEKEQKNDQVG